MKEYKLTDLPGLNNVEIERKEKLLLPDGRSFQINADKKSHAEGGVDIFAPSGTKIFSHYLKPGKKVAKELLKNKSYRSRMSFADISNKYDTTKYREIQNDSTGRYDRIAKETVALMENKYLAHQDTIFKAQEEYKSSRGMDNDLEFAKKLGGLPKYKYGGSYKKRKLPKAQIGMTTSYTDPYLLTNEYFKNPYTGRNLDYTTQPLYELPQDALRVLVPNYNPNTTTFGELNDVVNYANYDSFEGLQRPSDVMQPSKYYGEETKEREIQRKFGDRGYEIANYSGSDPVRLEQKYHLINKWREGELLTGNTQFPNDPMRSNIPQTIDGRLLKNLSSDEIRDPNLQVLDNNFFDDGYFEEDGNEYQNSYLINKTGEKSNGNLQPLPQKDFTFDATPEFNQPAEEEKPYVDDYEYYNFNEPKREEVGLDPMRYINGVQSAYLMGKLASTSVENPYYSYKPNKVAYTRFEPLNTKQQERAYNIGTKSLKNSHLPESIKAANRVKMQSNMSRGINEIDIRNMQGNLQNQNSNTQLLNQNNNANLQARENANLQYLQERGRLNYLAQKQRQGYIENALDIWRNQAETQYNRKLMSALSDQYDIDSRGNIIYTPGNQKLNNSQLDRFGQGGSGVDPTYLNEKGLRHYGTF